MSPYALHLHNQPPQSNIDSQLRISTRTHIYTYILIYVYLYESLPCILTDILRLGLRSWNPCSRSCLRIRTVCQLKIDISMIVLDRDNPFPHPRPSSSLHPSRLRCQFGRIHSPLCPNPPRSIERSHNDTKSLSSHIRLARKVRIAADRLLLIIHVLYISYFHPYIYPIYPLLDGTLSLTMSS